MHKLLAMAAAFLLAANALAAAKLEITAAHFRAAKSSHSGVFSGNVKLKRGEDFLHCERLVLQANAAGKLQTYEASGVQNMSIKLRDKTYSGRAKFVRYDARAKRYFLSGGVQINEGARQLNAQELIIDEAAGSYELKSAKDAPVKLIFEVGE